ncbi:MAG TPA: hypothetical protein VFO29_02290 [Candidatus Rubrimentiphilum sp.]|nr:hypothetical protein [Candidatus Rubrimentiphilum sp.]
MQLRIASLALTLAFSIGAAASAKCGSGLPPDYRDIQAVMFNQNGCGSTLHPLRRNAMTVSRFDCSSFYAVVWELSGPNGKQMQLLNDYVQYDLDGQIGTYKIEVSLSSVQELLRKDRFFGVAPMDLMPTDSSQAVISVKRCAVVTRVMIYNTNLPDLIDPAAAKLFQDLRRMIEKAPKRFVSRTPRPFMQKLLFDPLPI